MSDPARTPTRCGQCILPETIPGMTLDAQGLCSLCRKPEPEPPRSDPSELQDLLKRIQNLDRPIHAIVPLSGGRDSSYVLYVCARRFGLNVLAVNFDNDFREEGAIKNIESACSTLGVDAVVYSSEAHRVRTLVASRLRQFWMRTGRPIGVCDACAYGYRAAVYRTAVARGAPLIVWGDSSVESAESRLSEVRQAMGHTPASRWAKLAKLVDHRFFATEMRSLLQRIENPAPGCRLWRRSVPTLPPGETQEISLFRYLSWDRREIKETIQNELHWEKPKGKVSTWRTDCKLHDLINYWYVNALGCTKDAFGYSNMIAIGQMSRDEALAQEEAMVQSLRGFLPDSLRRLLSEEIGLRPEEINQLERKIPHR